METANETHHKRGRPRKTEGPPSTSKEYHREYMKRYYANMGPLEKKIRSAQQNHKVDRATAEKIAALDFGYGRNAQIKALIEEYKAKAGATGVSEGNVCSANCG